MTQRGRVTVRGLADVLCGEERRGGDGTARGPARLAPGPLLSSSLPPVPFLPGTLGQHLLRGPVPASRPDPPTKDLLCFPLSWSHASAPEGQGFVLTASWSVTRNRLCIERTY